MQALASHTVAKYATAKTGDGHAVVIFPGLGATGDSVSTLRRHCRSLGYDAFDWGQGFNTGPKGDLDAWLHALKSQVVELLAGHTQRATLIGWSLGGYANEELAEWVARIGASGAARVWAYFNNDREGHATRNARELIRQLKRAAPEYSTGATRTRATPSRSDS